jgi:hypothetical protein
MEESFGNKSGAVVEDNTHGVEPQIEQNGLHVARRGDLVDSDIDSSDIQGFDTNRMRARTLLTTEEEKRLLRRIDWHIMPLCSFMVSSLEYKPYCETNIVSYERILRRKLTYMDYWNSSC